MPQPSWDEFTSLLLAEKERLEAELAKLASPDPKMRGDWDAKFPRTAAMTGSLSHSAQDEQADLREEFEVSVAEEQALEGRLAEVTAALDRISAGTFGVCRTCGRAIPLERLRANPAAAYDIEHQPRE